MPFFKKLRCLDVQIDHVKKKCFVQQVVLYGHDCQGIKLKTSKAYLTK